MHSLEDAKAIVQRYLDTLSEAPDEPPLALTGHVCEYPFGWAFGYNARRHVESGRREDVLVGQGPLLFDKRTGAIIPTGSAQSESISAENYARYGAPYVELGSDVELAPARPDIDRRAAMRAIQAATGLGLQAARSAVDACLAGHGARVTCTSDAAAEALVDRLAEVGILAEGRPRWIRGREPG